MRNRDFALPKGDRSNRDVGAIQRLLGEDALAVAVDISAHRRRAVEAAAHVGVHSVALATFFNHVEAFEPQPDCYDCLTLNIDSPRITPRRIGLASVTGEGFVMGKGGANSLTSAFAQTERLSEAERKARRRSAAARIDDYGWSDVDLIRIGVSADIPDILEGGAATLKACAPTIWLTVRDKFFPETRSFAHALPGGALAGMGYRVVHEDETDIVLAPREAGAPRAPASGVYFSVDCPQLKRKALIAPTTEATIAVATTCVAVKRAVWPACGRLIRTDRGPVPLIRLDVGRGFGAPERFTPRLPGAGSARLAGPEADLAAVLERFAITQTNGGIDIALPLEAAAVADTLTVSLKQLPHAGAPDSAMQTERVIYRREIEDIETIDRIPVRIPRDAARTARVSLTVSLTADETRLRTRVVKMDIVRRHITPDLVTCYLNRGGGGNPAVEAMARALGAPTRYAEDGRVPGVAMVWGVLRGSKDVIDATIAEGGIFYYIDHAYFGRGHGRNYRITRNRFEAGPVREVPPDRIKALGVKTRRWRRGGRSIIVCPPTDYFMEAHGCHDWLDVTLAELARRTDRPVVVRTKPQPGETAIPLQEALRDAHALVTHSSNVAIEAAILGTPVFVSPSSAAAPVGCTDLAQIEKPIYPDRAPWLAHLAYNQFSFEEMASGAAWRLLADLENRPEIAGYATEAVAAAQ